MARLGDKWGRKARRWRSGSKEEKNSSLPASKALIRYSKNRRRNKRDRTRTGKKNPGRQEIHCVPSGESPPPATTQCKGGGWSKFDPQLWRTAKKPISAPRCLGSAAMV